MMQTDITINLYHERIRYTFFFRIYRLGLLDFLLLLLEIFFRIYTLWVTNLYIIDISALWISDFLFYFVVTIVVITFGKQIIVYQIDKIVR